MNRRRLSEVALLLRTQCVTDTELRADLGVTLRTMQRRRRAGEILAIVTPRPRVVFYPRWQFDLEWRVAPIVPSLIELAAEVQLTHLAVHLILTNPYASFGPLPLSDYIETREDDVLTVIAAAGSTESRRRRVCCSENEAVPRG